MAENLNGSSDEELENSDLLESHEDEEAPDTSEREENSTATG